MTNLNKTREEIIYELVLSFNKGDSCVPEDRVRLAVAQYTDLVYEKIITEWCEHDWQPIGQGDCPSIYKFQCVKCGAVEARHYPF